MIEFKDLISEIASKIKSENSSEVKSDRFSKYIDDTVPEFKLPCDFRDELKFNYKKSELTFFQKTLTFIRDYINKQREFEEHTRTVIIIPVYNKYITSLYKDTALFKDRLIEMGLISVENSNWNYISKKDKKNCCITFNWHCDNEKRFLDYCESNHIEAYEFESKTEAKTKRINKAIDKLEKNNIDIDSISVFSSKLRFEIPKYTKIDDLKEAIKSKLFEKYKDLHIYQFTIDYINKLYYDKEKYNQFVLTFEPNIHIDKDRVAQKIGIRYTNGFSNVSVANRKSFNRLHNYTLEKDIHNSVIRLAASIKAGHYITEKEIPDFYKLISEIAYPNEEFTDVVRNVLKEVVIRAYFTKSAKLLARDINRNVLNESIDYKSEDYEALKDFAERIYNAVHEITGDSIDNEIFYYESALYIRVLQSLLDNGFDCYTVYDCFYAKPKRKEKIVSHEFDYDFFSAPPLIDINYITNEMFENYINKKIEYYFNEIILYEFHNDHK